MLTWDTIVVGAGHNGLVLAAYLARAGDRVLVLEARDRVGGACTTEETWPGFKVSTAAYVVSLFRPEIVRDLELERHGYAVLRRDPSSFTPLPDGRSLLLGPDLARNQAEVAKLSPRDAARLPAYEALLERVARAIEPSLLETPPDPFSGRVRDLWRLARVGARLHALGEDGPAAVEIFTGAARDVLDRWFESDALKATLATDAIIGAWASPSTPGTAYVLFHHVMGAVDGARGVWGYVRGGMGALSEAIAAAAREAGAEIRTSAPVARVLVRGGEAEGVVLESGDELYARRVASNADAARTLLTLVGAEHLAPELAERARRIDHRSGSLKINLALAALPRFRGLPGGGGTPGPEHRGTIHVAPSLEYLERAFDDARATAAPRATRSSSARSRRRSTRLSPPRVGTSCRCSCSTRRTRCARAAGTTSGSGSPTAASTRSRPTRPGSAPPSSLARCSRPWTSSAASASLAGTSSRGR